MTQHEERTEKSASPNQLESSSAQDATWGSIDDLPWIIPRPSLAWRIWRRIDLRVREWWCGRVGHDYEGGSGFNGDYVQHWYQCRRCGDGGSD